MSLFHESGKQKFSHFLVFFLLLENVPMFDIMFSWKSSALFFACCVRSLTGRHCMRCSDDVVAIQSDSVAFG